MNHDVQRKCFVGLSLLWLILYNDTGSNFICNIYQTQKIKLS